MAKGNPILGTMQGTIGDVTTYNYNGKQVTRVRRRTIRNPRTNKQAIQRTIASTVAKFVSAFAPVLNNSLQNEGSKVSTLAKIRSLNMNMLRQLAAQKLGTYAEKGSMFVAPNDYLISRGSLAGLNPLTGDEGLSGFGEGYISFPLTVINCAGLDTFASICFPTVEVGDQITILAARMEDSAEGSRTAYCRFAFKDDTTPCFIAAEGENVKLNPAAIDQTKAEGPWKELRFLYDGDQSKSNVYVAAMIGGNYEDPIDMAGVIVSREAGKLRSTAHMISRPNVDYTLALVYPTYMDGGTPIDIPSDTYLNNDANVI